MEKLDKKTTTSRAGVALFRPTEYCTALRTAVWGAERQASLPLSLTRREAESLQVLDFCLRRSDLPRGLRFGIAWRFAEEYDVLHVEGGDDVEAFQKRLEGLDRSRFNPDGSRKRSGAT